MRLRRLLLLPVLTAAASALPTLVDAAVYRWVDANGVVNYGNQRPAAQTGVTQLDAMASRVSIVPSPTADELARQRVFLLERRVERLEAELASARTPTTSVVMLGQPSPSFFASAPVSFGWWGAPVMVTRGWSVRRFPQAGWPGHVAPRPMPHPASAPMRFQNASRPSSRAAHR